MEKIMIIHHVTSSEFKKLKGDVVDYQGNEAKIDGNHVYILNEAKKASSYNTFTEPDSQDKTNSDGKDTEPDSKSKRQPRN